MLAWSLAAVCVQHTLAGFRRCRITRKCPYPTLTPGDSPRLYYFIQPRSILFLPTVKSYFSFLPIDLGMFAIGKQKRRGRHCWALPSAEPPTRACVCLCGTCWELKPPLPCPFLSACTLPRTHMALLLCKAELCLLGARGSVPGARGDGAGLSMGPSWDSSPSRGAGGLMEQDSSMFSFVTVPSTGSWQLG